jgi:rfaE bifunctional protein kinase chain/domain
MKHSSSSAVTLSRARAAELLQSARKSPVLVVGDAMLDHFVWGSVGRISPEAPVPVVDFQRESYMPGGAANVARNLSALDVPNEFFAVIGDDPLARHLRQLLINHKIGCKGLLTDRSRLTSVKTRIIAHQQQVVRIDRETRSDLSAAQSTRLIQASRGRIRNSAAVIVGDYGKGVVTQALLNALKKSCREAGVWLSVDPKPVHHLDLAGLSLLTPNRKEAFELAAMPDNSRHADPLRDKSLLSVAAYLLKKLKPVVLLITLGEQGMLLCRRGETPFHIPTIAQEVFDVSGAGDTVIATFTLAIAGGASPVEAAIISNHSAGIVVGKVGTATVSADELLASFPERT